MMMSWRARALGTLLSLFVAVGAASAQSAAPSLQLTNEFQARTLLFSNFFEAPDGTPHRDVSALRIDWLASGDPDGSNRWRLYGRAGVILYEEFGASPGFTAGVRRNAGRHAVDISGGSEWGRPTVDVGDTFAEVRALSAEAEYGFRVARPVELLGLFNYRSYAVENHPERDANDYLLGAGVQFRTFGDQLVPSITMAGGSRNSNDRNQGFGQLQLLAEVRSTLDHVRLRVRYRHRVRDYDEDIRGSNAGREDRRHRATAEVQFPFHRRFAAIAGYQIERARSTRPGRDFITQLFQGGVTVRLDTARPRNTHAR